LPITNPLAASVAAQVDEVVRRMRKKLDIIEYVPTKVCEPALAVVVPPPAVTEVTTPVAER